MMKNIHAYLQMSQGVPGNYHSLTYLISNMD